MSEINQQDREAMAEARKVLKDFLKTKLKNQYPGEKLPEDVLQEFIDRNIGHELMRAIKDKEIAANIPTEEKRQKHRLAAYGGIIALIVRDFKPEAFRE